MLMAGSFVATLPSPARRRKTAATRLRAGVAEAGWPRYIPNAEPTARSGRPTPLREPAMTTFDDREKAFEAKFKLDQDALFKVNNRGNRLLGLWVAAEIGKSGADADAYAKEIVLADFDKPGDDDVVQRVLKDLEAAGKPSTAATIRGKLAKFQGEAKKQLMAEAQK
jgi:hypothetical protein